MTLSEYYVGLLNEQKRIPALKPITAGLNDVMARLLLLKTTYDNFIAGKTLMVEFPYSEIQKTIVSMQALIDLSASTLDTPWDFIVALRDEMSALRNLRVVKDAFSTRTGVAEAVDNVFIYDSRSRKGYIVQWADTLRGIAQRFLKDGSRWTEIASLNHLDYPYIVNTSDEQIAGKKILLPGDIVTLPLDAQNPENKVIGETPTDYDTLLGQDVQLTPSGYIDWDKIGDFVLISGGDNLAQAVRHRLVVPKGQLPLHPDYGSELEAYIGDQASDATVQQASLESRRTVLQDPRVTRVENLLGSFSSTTITADMTVRVIGQESPMSLNMVIPRPA